MADWFTSQSASSRPVISRLCRAEYTSLPVSSLSRPPGCVRARVSRREVTNLRLILRELVGQLRSITARLNNHFSVSSPFIFTLFSFSRVSIPISASLNGPVKPRGTKGEVFEQKVGLPLPLGRFLFKRAQEVRRSSRAELRETIVVLHCQRHTRKESSRLWGYLLCVQGQHRYPTIILYIRLKLERNFLQFTM